MGETQNRMLQPPLGRPDGEHVRMMLGKPHLIGNRRHFAAIGNQTIEMNVIDVSDVAVITARRKIILADSPLIAFQIVGTKNGDMISEEIIRIVDAQWAFRREAVNDGNAARAGDLRNSSTQPCQRVLDTGCGKSLFGDSIHR